MSPRLADEVRELAGEGFDVVFEASGAKAALRQAFDQVRPGGTIVQIGTLGTEDIPLPANQLMVREINLVGSMRYGNVFGEAIRLVESGRINVRGLISDVRPLADVAEALRVASGKSAVLKVQLEL
jgi:L-idonate 5-dehydrogenase